MFKELFKDTKVLTSAGAVVIALALIWLIDKQWTANTEALKAVAAAISANTAVTSQFQSLLLDLQKSPQLRSNLENQLFTNNGKSR